MRVPMLAAVSAAVLACSFTAASAVTPKLLGNYTLEFRDVCPNVISVNNGTVTDADSGVTTQEGPVVSGVGLNGGDAKQYLFSVSFFSTGGLSFTGFKDGGSLVTIQENGGGTNQGDPFAETAQSGTGTFSNTARTLTLQGKTFNAFYDNVDFRGVAHGVRWLGIFTNQSGATCSEQGSAVKQ